jgi:hypothetical protein
MPILGIFTFGILGILFLGISTLGILDHFRHF